MKRRRSCNSKIFSFLNIILIGLLFVELVFMANWVTTGNPVKGVGLGEEGEQSIGKTEGNLVSQESKGCTIEVCNRLDEDCDGLIDDSFLCDLMSKAEDSPKFNGYIVQLRDEPVSKIYVNELKNVEKGVSTKQALKEKTNSYRKNIIDKQNNLENNIKNLYPKAKFDSKIQDVFNGFLVSDISEFDIEKIKKLPGVKEVSPNYEVHTMLMDSVPLINADDVWNLQVNGTNLTGEGVTIGIIDTGVDYTHPDLGGCFGIGCKVVGGWDFYNNDADPKDDHGHGTHVAAIAAGNGVLKGVAPDAKIYTYKVLSNMGGGTAYKIIQAINRATDPNQDRDFSDHLDVVSMSLGGAGNPDDPMSQAVDNAVDLGVVAIVAAGNSGSNLSTINSPGTARKAITVGATYKSNYGPPFNFSCSPNTQTSCGTCGANGKVLCDYWGDKNPETDQITSFSSRGPIILNEETIIKPDVVAPGAIICAARYNLIYPQGTHPYYYPCLDEQHVQFAGTSMATPIVAGASALLIQAHQSWTPEEIKYILKNSADNPQNVDIFKQGYGRLNSLASLELGRLTAKLYESSVYYDGIFGIHEITGEINGEEFSSYSFEYMPYDDRVMSNWVPLTTSSILPPNRIVNYNWDTRMVHDGDYLLSLSVTDQNNHKTRDIIFVKVYNDMRVKLLSDFNYPPMEENNILTIPPREKVYLKAVATAFNSSKEGICSLCTYQWYQDGTLLSITSNEYTALLGTTGLHQVKVRVIDSLALKEVEKEINIEYGLLKINNDNEYRFYPRMFGDKIVYSQMVGGNIFERDIYMYDILTGVTTQISNFPGMENIPDIYENKIVYDGDQGSGDYDVYMYDILTGATTQITYSPGNQINPKIHGNRILWTDTRNGNWDIYMYDLDSGLERLVIGESGYFSFYGDVLSYSKSDHYIRAIFNISNMSSRPETIFFGQNILSIEPDVQGKKIVWTDPISGVYLYDVDQKMTTNLYSLKYSNDAVVYGDNVVWTYEKAVKLFNLNNNLTIDLSYGWQGNVAQTSIYENYVLWAGYRQTPVFNIYLADLTPTSCADINHDGIRDVIDVVKLVGYAFRGEPAPNPYWIGDMNGDGIVDVIDVVKLVGYAFRGEPEPTCTSQPLTTSSSATASLGSANGTATAKTIPVNLANTESVAGTTFKISYDPLKLGTLKNVRLATRTTGMELIRNGNTITIIKQDGSLTIPKGSGTIFYLDFIPPKTGFSASSLKITEVKAANPKANKIAVKIGSSVIARSTNLA
ncbi:S8 family serine peptidase [Candidatus Pacearchaeota archaeon]|nr:S8 family serine peptidase [Candidatus Pacearchaeota archaeon]